MLEVRDLSLGYGDDLVLDDTDLDVVPGEVVSVVGPSGSGKTSLLLSLCGLLRPAGGSVTVDGVDLATASTRTADALRRNKFGFVFQFGDLVPELTLVENVALPLRLLGHPHRRAIARALDQMADLGIDHLAAKSVAEVSGGELQRAAICRALVHRPAVVLADEPTGALDETNAQLVFAELVRHSREAGAAVVVVTHESALARTTDRVVRIDDRRLVPG